MFYLLIYLGPVRLQRGVFALPLEEHATLHGALPQVLTRSFREDHLDGLRRHVGRLATPHVATSKKQKAQAKLR